MTFETTKVMVNRIRESFLPVYFSFVVVALLVVSIAPQLAGFTRLSPEEMNQFPVTNTEKSQPYQSGDGQKLEKTAIADAVGTLERSPPESDRIAGDQADGSAEVAQESSSLTDSGVMPVEYSIPSRETNVVPSMARPDGSLRIRKAVYRAGSAIGSIEITIDRTSRLLLETRDVRQLLGDSPSYRSNLARLPSEGLVSIRTLREAGIDLRYSPNEDIIRLQ